MVAIRTACCKALRLVKEGKEKETTTTATTKKKKKKKPEEAVKEENSDEKRRRERESVCDRAAAKQFTTKENGIKS